MDQTRERAGGGVVLLVIAVLALLVGGGWAAAYYRAGDTLAHGTSVEGVDIGERTPAQAVAVLRTSLRARATHPITVSAGGRTLDVSPVKAGLGIDYTATVDQASTARSWRPEKLWEHYSGGGELEPVMSVDETRMAATVAQLNRRLGTTARDGAIAFRGDHVEVTHPRTGHQLDPAETANALEAAYVNGSSEALLALHDVTPLVDDAAIQRATDRIVNPALAGSVRLLFGGTPVRLQPRDFTDALRLTARDGRLVPHVDAARLRHLVGRADGYDRPPVDATVQLVDGHPRIVPGQPGEAYSSTAISRAFLRAVQRDLRHRTAHVTGHPTRPAVGVRAVRRWQVDRVVATGSARTTSQRLRPAVEAFDQRVLPPHHGVVLGRALRDLADTPGVNRLAEALDKAAIRAGLATTGQDAQLRLRNTTSYGVLLHVTLHGSGHHRTVRAEVWSR